MQNNAKYQPRFRRSIYNDAHCAGTLVLMVIYGYYLKLLRFSVAAVTVIDNNASDAIGEDGGEDECCGEGCVVVREEG